MLISGPGFLSVRLIEGVRLFGGPLHRGFTGIHLSGCEDVLCCSDFLREQGTYKVAHPITIVTLQTKRAWRTCLFATAVFSHVSLLEYFCSHVQDPVMILLTQKAQKQPDQSYLLCLLHSSCILIVGVLYKRSTKCRGDKSITTFTDCFNCLHIERSP